MELKEALKTLDVSNDSQWTTDGAPKIDILKELTGLSNLTRQDVVDADPNFSRSNPYAESAEPGVDDNVVTIDELLKLPYNEVAASKDKCEKLQAHFAKLHSELVAELNDVQDEIKEINLKLTVINRFVAAHQKTQKSDSASIQEYLAVNNKARLDKKLAVKEALKGVNVTEVMKHMDPRSRLDRRLKAKNPERVTNPEKA